MTAQVSLAQQCVVGKLTADDLPRSRLGFGVRWIAKKSVDDVEGHVEDYLLNIEIIDRHTHPYISTLYVSKLQS